MIDFQPILDWLITILILIGLFFLGYAAIKHKSLLDTVKEIREIIKGKADEAKEAMNFKYA